MGIGGKGTVDRRCDRLMDHEARAEIWLGRFYTVRESNGASDAGDISRPCPSVSPVSCVNLVAYWRLQYAELPPAPLQTTAEAEALFEKKATDVRNSSLLNVVRRLTVDG